jgi:hemolysin III
LEVHTTSGEGQEKRFSHAYFFAVTVTQIIVWFSLLYWPLKQIWPDIWERQLGAGFGKIILVILATHLVLCFFEFFFHRYVLHSVTLSFLAVFAKKHRHHHGLTHVVEVHSPDTGEVTVRNKYPIVEPEQHESAAFPIYALVSFWAVFSPAILLSQWLMPHVPIVVGGYLGVAWSYFLYETWHAIEHLSYEEVWGPLTKGRLGKFFRPIYGFHLMHHYNPKSNEAISGFFGLPLADWLLGTFRIPKVLPLHGEAPDPSLSKPVKPMFLVRWMDTLSDSCERKYQKKRGKKALRQHQLASAGK